MRYTSCQFLPTYNVFIAKSSKLRQFLRHQQFGFSDGGQNTFSYVLGNRGVVAELLEITDLLFEFENLNLQ